MNVVILQILFLVLSTLKLFSGIIYLSHILRIVLAKRMTMLCLFALVFQHFNMLFGTNVAHQFIEQNQLFLIFFFFFSEIATLRKKFEEDKQRIALMKASRKFRPY